MTTTPAAFPAPKFRKDRFLSRCPARASLRQRVDTTIGQLVEDLECGHTVPTPFSFRTVPYLVGVRRRCKECYRAELAVINAPPPPRDEDALALAAATCGADFQCFPIAQEISGVYCLMRRGRVMYVGQSRNLLARLGGHVKTFRKKFDSIRFAHVQRDRLDAVEGALIRALRPPLNRQIPGEVPTLSPRPKTEISDSPREVGGDS